MKSETGDGLVAATTSHGLLGPVQKDASTRSSYAHEPLGPGIRQLREDNPLRLEPNGYIHCNQNQWIMHKVLRTPSLYSLILAALLLVLCSSESSAQWRTHIKVGVVGSTLRGDAKSDLTPVARFSGGAGVSYELRGGFRIQSEFLYSVKGATEKELPIVVSAVANPVLVDATSERTYLEIPLLLVYRFDRAGIRPRIFAGPTLAYKLDAKISWRSPEGGPEFQETDDEVENMDFGLTLGGGFDMDIGSEILEIGVRTVLGLSNARTAKPELYNTAVAVYAGITF